MPDNEGNWNDREKHEIRQYERMQDILVSYSTLGIKALAVICGGALVSIGAAFMNFLSLRDTANEEAVFLMKETLANGFEIYSAAMLWILFGLIVLYFSRSAYLISCDEYRHSEAVKKRHQFYGVTLEAVAVGIYIYVFYLIFSGFKTLSHAFNNFPL